jgi:hypothetical protein
MSAGTFPLDSERAMTDPKLALLHTLSFGRSVAEQEAESLVNYFVETPQWKKNLRWRNRSRTWPQGQRQERYLCFDQAPYRRFIR